MKKKHIIIIVISLISLLFWSFPREENGYVLEPGDIVIDVRTEWEFNMGHLKGAIHIPYQNILSRIGEYADNKDEKIVLYCRSGRRSGIARDSLQRAGYLNAINAGAYVVLKKLNP